MLVHDVHSIILLTYLVYPIVLVLHYLRPYVAQANADSLNASEARWRHVGPEVPAIFIAWLGGS